MLSRVNRFLPLSLFLALCSACAGPAAVPRTPADRQIGTAAGLWPLYTQGLRGAKYIDLTHTLSPNMPVWKGFGPSQFLPAADPATGEAYRYEHDGFEATRYALSTDQLGTQLDPPAHWAPEFPAIDELPATYAIRPLVVVSIVEQVAADPNYHLQVRDLLQWEQRYGRIPEGSVVMVRSDWSSRWPDPRPAEARRFPGVSLAALQWLHQQRRILLHGHEPLDTDSTPGLEGERWLMHHGYAQAEGVANLDLLPPRGCLVTLGFPKFQGGLGGYARYIAICPPEWPHGITVGEVPEAPLPRSDRPLRWDARQGVRLRR